jgi:hypothetical protein
MNKKTAGLLFAGVCIVLAILLLAHSIKPIIGGVLFAFALVILGILSKGFRRE